MAARRKSSRPGPKQKYNYRSSVTGRWITRKKAERRPSESEKERRK